MAGYIPKTIVKTTKVSNIKNSRLFTSLILASKNLLKDPPKAILLNINIVYAAEKTIDELAKAPNKGNLSKVPYKHINSPTKFKVKGVPALPNDNMKNKIENKGIT